MTNLNKHINHESRKKYLLNEKDLSNLGILEKYDSLRLELYLADQRKDCAIIQGSAFIFNGQAFLVLGVGGIDFLDSLSQIKEVDGIIGNGNTLFISRDFKNVYSAHSSQELRECYELEGYDYDIKFYEKAPIASLIFLLRSFHAQDEYSNAKRKTGNIIFEVEDTFAGIPVNFAGSWKSRLRGKFISTTRIVHCASRPNLMKKECLFDSYEDVHELINNYVGSFVLIYTLWKQELCDVVGMKNTRQISDHYNPTDPITSHFIDVIKKYKK